MTDKTEQVKAPSGADITITISLSEPPADYDRIERRRRAWRRERDRVLMTGEY